MRLAVEGGLGPAAFTNIYWLNCVEGSPPPNEGSVHELTDDFIGTLFHTYSDLGTSVNVTTVRAVYHREDGVFLESENDAAVSGGVSGDIADANSCVIISWSGRFHYRGGKPRTYLPGVPATAEDDSQHLNADYIASLASDANNFLSAVNALTTDSFTDVKLGTVRFASGGSWLDPPFFVAYNGAVVHPRIGTQRRRLGTWLP